MRILAAVIILIATSLYITGLKWGLPDSSIRTFSPPPGEIPYQYVKQAWKISKEHQDIKLPRSVFNIVRSFHPDEQNILKCIAGMSPENLDFNPHFFEYPSAQIYLVAAVLKTVSSINLIKVKSDIGYYFEHPEEMAKIYFAGRITTVLMAVAGLIFFYLLGLRLCGRKGGLFATACLALSPLYVINSHYMTVDIPMVFWIIATIFFTIAFINRRSKFLFFLAAFSSGIACGTKYPAGFLIFLFPFVFKECFRNSWKKIFLYTLASFVVFLIAFFITTPYSLLSFHEFKRDILYQTGARGVGAGSLLNIFSFFFHLLSGLWVGVFLISILFIPSVFLQARRRNSFDRLILTGLVLSIAPLMVSSGFKYVRYYLLILPFLCLSAGCLFEEFFKTGKRLRTFLIILSLFLLSGSIAKSAAYSILMTKPDVRLVSARYLDKSITAGSDIVFTKEPWVFEVPPVNPLKYSIKIIDERNLEKVHSGSYLIIGELQYFLTAGNRKKEMKKKIFQLQQSGFALKMIFETHAKFLGIKFDEKWTIHDMLYTHPRIFVFYKL